MSIMSSSLGLLKPSFSAAISAHPPTYTCGCRNVVPKRTSFNVQLKIRGRNGSAKTFSRGLLRFATTSETCSDRFAELVVKSFDTERNEDEKSLILLLVTRNVPITQDMCDSAVNRLCISYSRWLKITVEKRRQRVDRRWCL